MKCDAVSFPVVPAPMSKILAVLLLMTLVTDPRIYEGDNTENKGLILSKSKKLDVLTIPDQGQEKLIKRLTNKYLGSDVEGVGDITYYSSRKRFITAKITKNVQVIIKYSSEISDKKVAVGKYIEFSGTLKGFGVNNTAIIEAFGYQTYHVLNIAKSLEK